MTQTRNEVVGLAGQIILRIGSQQSSYVGLHEAPEPLEVIATVLVMSDSLLTIENPYSIESRDSPGLELEISELPGRVVESAFWTTEDLVLEIAGGLRLCVSLREEDFRTPEAASYSPNQGSIVVFD